MNMCGVSNVRVCRQGPDMLGLSFIYTTDDAEVKRNHIGFHTK